MATSDSTTFEYYRYTPSIAAAVVFIICFFLTTATHTFQLIKSKTWYFTPMIVGGCFEWIGYLARVISSKQTPNYTLGPYIIQAILLLVAPALFAASIYMVLGRIILLVDGEAYSPIKRRWLTKLFVFGDCFSFFLQASGGGLMGVNASYYSIGQKIILAGLFLQVLFFGLFVVVAIVFQTRLNRTSAPQISSFQTNHHHQLSAKYLTVLYAASALIMIRSIFRVVEYIMGNAGYLMRHEVFLYLFDAVLMLAVMVLFNVFYPDVLTKTREAGKESGGDLEFGHAAAASFGDVKMVDIRSNATRI